MRRGNTMTHNEIISSYPLTELQKGMLFEIACNRYLTPIYIVQNIFELQDDLNIQFIIKAFHILLGRHEMLRSSIAQNSTGYIQVIYKLAEIPYEFYNYSNLSLEESLKKFDLFLENDARCEIDLSKPPLMRLTFFKFKDRDYRFVWTRHHILMDGTSVEILIDELFTIYHALLKNTEWILPERASYAKDMIKSEPNDETIKNYWLDALKEYSDAALLPVLPSQYKNLKKIKYKYELVEESQYTQLVDFLNKHSLTVNTILQGALGVALSHYSDKDSIMIGTVRAYPKEKINNRIGLFVNTLPVCLEVNPSNKIIDYLQSIRQKNKSLKEYVTTPLNKIKEWCDLPLDSTLFQCVMDYKPRSLKTVLKKHFPMSACNALIKLDIPYPLMFEVINVDGSLQINFHYDAELIEDYYAASLLKHFKDILIAMSLQDIVYLSELSTLAESELTRITNWNKTESSYPTHKTIHLLFEEQVQKTPSAISVCYENEILTYQMLNHQANQLAHYLISQGVEFETRVAICLKPTLNMLIAVLGVLKAGGVYIPIDTQYPIERIRYLLQDSQPKIVITQSDQFNLLDKIIFSANTPTPVFVNLDKTEWQHCAETNPVLPIRSSHGMYIIYTSGSTGNPKGVLLEHLSVVNTALSCIEKLKITPQSRILQISSFSFDVSVAEWSMALLSGASIYLTNKDIFSPKTIIESLKTYKITTIILASAILAVLPKEYLPDLKVIAPGGEPCGQSVIDFWAQDRLFVNVYGITEAAICSTMSNFSPEHTKTSDIGKPLPNTQIYILDRHLRPVPIGVTGEIYISGMGIARGYINNHELNQEKFIFHTMGLKDKKTIVRLYKTGDYGRWLTTGNIECLGRHDAQIKLRGFRVELTEIEQVLERYPTIKKAAVITKDTPAGRQLYAYILPVQQFVIDTNEIQKFVQAQLPSFMVPAKLVPINELPLTHNGKIDKQKLLSMSSADNVDMLNYSSSTISGLEETIKKVAQDLLQCNVSIDENFLDLGFESLSLVKFSANLSHVLEKTIDVIDLFTYTTIKSLATYISSQNNNKNRYGQSQSTAVRANRVVFVDEY